LADEDSRPPSSKSPPYALRQKKIRPKRLVQKRIPVPSAAIHTLIWLPGDSSLSCEFDRFIVSPFQQVKVLITGIDASDKGFMV
jgi:hypothetical protein